MSEDNIQRKMDFIVEHQAKFSVDIELLKESQKQLTADVSALTNNVESMRAEMQTDRQETRALIQETRALITDIVTQMQAGFQELIVANEVTRKLAEDTARIAIGTSQRVTKLEEKAS